MAEQTITGRLIANKFKVTGLQRSGRMGDVYVARRIDTNAMVSIKMLDPALFGEQEAKKRFEREARITLRLDHPCTLVVEEFGRTSEGWPFMALEYVDGELLAEIIEESPNWYQYDLPDHLVGISWKGRWRGQTQKWFAIRFTGEDSEIDISGIGHKAEFDDWRWAGMDEVAEKIVPFKRPVYDQVIADFRHLGA